MGALPFGLGELLPSSSTAVCWRRRLHAAVPRHFLRGVSTHHPSDARTTPHWIIYRQLCRHHAWQAERCNGVAHECTRRGRCLRGHRHCGGRPRRAFHTWRLSTISRSLLTTGPASVREWVGRWMCHLVLTCTVRHPPSAAGDARFTEPTLEASRLPPRMCVGITVLFYPWGITPTAGHRTHHSGERR